MLYEWINDRKVSICTGHVSRMQPLTIEQQHSSDRHMIYANVVEEGWKADGWYEISGSVDTETDDDDHWYSLKRKGETG